LRKTEHNFSPVKLAEITDISGIYLMDVALIIPEFNEEASISNLVGYIPAGVASEILVNNNYSTGHSAEVALMPAQKS
jgi:hypothetical protein